VSDGESSGGVKVTIGGGASLWASMDAVVAESSGGETVTIGGGRVSLPGGADVEVACAGPGDITAGFGASEDCEAPS
jgi:hypothetical protein